jgi:hypothetical protein
VVLGQKHLKTAEVRTLHTPQPDIAICLCQFEIALKISLLDPQLRLTQFGRSLLGLGSVERSERC